MCIFLACRSDDCGKSTCAVYENKTGKCYSFVFLLLSSTRRRSRYCPPFPYWQGDACTVFQLVRLFMLNFRHVSRIFSTFFAGGGIFLFCFTTNQLTEFSSFQPCFWRIYSRRGTSSVQLDTRFRSVEKPEELSENAINGIIAKQIWGIRSYKYNCCCCGR